MGVQPRPTSRHPKYRRSSMLRLRPSLCSDTQMSREVGDDTRLLRTGPTRHTISLSTRVSRTQWPCYIMLCKGRTEAVSMDLVHPIVKDDKEFRCSIES